MIVDIQAELLKIHIQKHLEPLLKDKTTKTNIIWATDAYSDIGKEYHRDNEISVELVTGNNSNIIRNRATKELHQQSERTRQHAEVFTPLWICEKMNDHIDEVWFDRRQGIHKEDAETGHIKFTANRPWKRYVDSRRLEITCGEAPYLVSRYDVSSGEAIPLAKRTGILDRKLRAVNENAETEKEWVEWAIRAFQATYGYEFQGDNLLIARVNLLMSFEEYLFERWNRKPTEQEYKKIINILCWNIWQMDGLTGTIPYRKAEDEYQQMDFFSLMGTEADAEEKNRQPRCRIYDWRRQNSLEFLSLNKGERSMKFDYIIGNPPYQEEVSESEENSSLSKQLFPSFIKESVPLASNAAVLITPSRWFAGDAQDKSFLKLRNFFKENNHICKIVHFPDGRDVFENVVIKGGVNYFVYKKDFSGGVEFSTVEHGKTTTLNRPLFEDGLDVVMTDPIKISVLMKVKEKTAEYLTTLTKGRNAFGIIGKESVVNDVSNSEPFEGCCELRLKGDVIRYITEDKVSKNIDVFNSYKIFVSKSAGAPNTDFKIIGKSYFGGRKTACTDSLIPIGCFQTEDEAINLQKYMSTKFLRFMVSILKMSQNVTQIVYRYVPLQDFTPSSDIDWSKPIPEIDRQLYAKYGLDEKEIEFIESHVKEMA